jgi:hypothetical protein
MKKILTPSSKTLNVYSNLSITQRITLSLLFYFLGLYLPFLQPIIHILDIIEIIDIIYEYIMHNGYKIKRDKTI